MNTEATAAYWEDRHRRFGRLTSGGIVGVDDAANEIFYAMRLGRLLDLVGDRSESTAPLRVLDAGCGKGWFTRSMARFGHRVDGIDVSDAAIQACRSQAIGLDDYAVSTLAEWRPPYLYDVVFTVDVLFHVMDDTEWEASVRNLAALVRLGGRLVLSDHDADVDRTWAPYQRTRGLPRYRQLLRTLGFGADRFVPYGFRGTPVGFIAFDRLS